MTSKESLQLVEAKKDIAYMKDDLKEVRSDIKKILKRLDDDRLSHDQFVTKAGLTKTASIILTLATLFFIFYDHIKEALK